MGTLTNVRSSADQEPTGQLVAEAAASGAAADAGDLDGHDYGREFEATLTGHGITLLCPARAGATPRPGGRLFQPLRQVIESINDTLEGQLGLEQHGGPTPTGVWLRVLQRVLALTTVLRHDDHIGAPTPRSLIAYDH